MITVKKNLKARLKWTWHEEKRTHLGRWWDDRLGRNWHVGGWAIKSAIKTILDLSSWSKIRLEVGWTRVVAAALESSAL